MVVKSTFAECSGCGLCAHACKNNAITMQSGKDGFFYPFIDEALCTNCGICKSVCPFTHTFVSQHPTKEAYALKQNEAVRKSSSSGGFFTLLSDYILQNNGVVYGAVWTEEFSVKHIRAESKEVRNKMRSSKYIQSDISSLYSQLKTDVADRRLVLFTGTPCQCAAIYRLYAKKIPENLWIMDVVCHGVMPQTFMDSYLKDISAKNIGKKIKFVNMRDKRFGWQTVGVEFEDGSVYHSEADYFYKVYAMHSLQRPSCFSCTCTKDTRFSDFTAGDFWGIQKSHPELHDDLGVSLVLINSEKGQKLYSALTENVISVPVLPEVYIPFQPNLRRPTERGERADKFQTYYLTHGYKKTMHRFFDVTMMRRINSLVAVICNKLLRR